MAASQIVEARDAGVRTSRLMAAAPYEILTFPDHPTTTATAFDQVEREYVRRELDVFFSTLPTVAEGFQLGTWSSAVACVEKTFGGQLVGQQHAMLLQFDVVIGNLGRRFL